MALASKDLPNKELVDKLASRGFRLIFWVRGQDATKWKAPQEKGWNEKRYIADDYRENMNVGVILGTEIAPNRFLADVDLDLPGISSYAGKILPPTHFQISRKGKEHSHLFYTTSKPVTTRQFLHPITGQMILEVRGLKTDGSEGFQTVVPPSIHPTGERLYLETEVIKADDGLGAIVHADDVLYRATLCATLVLLISAFPNKSFQHKHRNACAGFLLAEGLNTKDVAQLVTMLANETGNDIQDAHRSVKSTAEQIAKGGPVVAGRTLAELLGENGKKIVDTIREWISGRTFLVDGKSRVIANDQENIRLALDKMGASLSYDEFADKKLLRQNESNVVLSDAERLRLWFELDIKFRFRPSKEFFYDILDYFSRQNSYHPVRDYFDSIKWDGVERLDTWLVDCARAGERDIVRMRDEKMEAGGIHEILKKSFAQQTMLEKAQVEEFEKQFEQDREQLMKYVRGISSRVLIAAIRRVRRPGTKYDELLVLESPQGWGKSTALKLLCPWDELFSDHSLLSLDSRELLEVTLGKLMIEFPEMSGLNARDAEHVKAMLSRTHDSARPAYGREPIERARQFVPIGTTNDRIYLADTTGNRRFWPISVERFNLTKLREIKEQLWAEASVREAKGESIQLDQEIYEIATRQQEQRQRGDDWFDVMEDYIKNSGRDRFSLEEVWSAVGLQQKALRKQSDNVRLTKVMERLGYHRMAIQIEAEEVDQQGRKIGIMKKIIKGWKQHKA